MSASSSFECAICMEYYNAEANVPTSFPCGHSCCLRHTAAMMICHVCRRKLPDELTVNITIRDGAVEMMETLEKMKRLLLAATTAGPVEDSNASISAAINASETVFEPVDSDVDTGLDGAVAVAAIDLNASNPAAILAKENFQSSVNHADAGLPSETTPVLGDDAIAVVHLGDGVVDAMEHTHHRKKRSNKKKKKTAPIDAEANARAIVMAELVAEGILSAQAAALDPDSDELMFRGFNTLPISDCALYTPERYRRWKAVLKGWYFVGEIADTVLMNLEDEHGVLVPMKDRLIWSAG